MFRGLLRSFELYGLPPRILARGRSSDLNPFFVWDQFGRKEEVMRKLSVAIPATALALAAAGCGSQADQSSATTTTTVRACDCKRERVRCCRSGASQRSLRALWRVLA